MSELDFIEACHSATRSEAEWGVALAECLSRVVPEARHVMAAPYQLDDEGGRFLEIVGNARYVSDPTMEARSRASWEGINRSPVRRRILAGTYGSELPHALTLSSLPGDQGAPIREHIPWPAGDCLGLFGTLDGRRGYKLSPVGSERISFSRRRRALLVRLCEHLAAGYWLRALRPPASPLEDAAAAVCTPDGRVLHDAGTAPELSARLVDAVRNMDRARCRRKKRTPEEAAELWQALLAGRYTLVESTERGGRRVILAVRCRAPRPALSAREAAVAVAAARGDANKAIAGQLGLATGTVGVHLAAALRKLGCPNRKALAQWLRAGGLS